MSFKALKFLKKLSNRASSFASYRLNNLQKRSSATGYRPFNILHGKNLSILSQFKSLPLKRNKVLAEYVWIGGTGSDLRNKTRFLEHNDDRAVTLNDIPNWSFDGSSTGQAPGEDSEVVLKPVKVVPDPFRMKPHVLVLCECMDPQGNPIPTNFRSYATKVFNHPNVKETEPWYGLEQEYTLFTSNGAHVLGFPTMGIPPPQGQYYCASGVENAFGRHIAEAHLFACLYAGLNIGGTNAEVMPGSWEYQIGPATGVDAGDQLWLARYIMERLGEELEIQISYDPKPVRKGDWNGAGCHANFSTNAMRSPGGINLILDAMKDLEANHAKHMALYGEGNESRMTGKHETASFSKFTWGVADRGASVRISRKVESDKCGFFEDRRPAANMDPYAVCGLIADTVLIEKPATGRK